LTHGKTPNLICVNYFFKKKK